MNDVDRPVRRVGAVVGIRPDAVDEYCRLHAEIWPGVAAANREAGLTNHSIFLLREHNLAFSYGEYSGDDRSAAIARLAASPTMQEWWRLCRPMQVPIIPQSGARRWADMNLIYHQP